MSNIDITPINEEEQPTSKSQKNSKSIDPEIKVENLRHSNFIKELEGIKYLMLLQNTKLITERGEITEINKKNSEISNAVSQPISFPQPIEQPFKKIQEPKKRDFKLFKLLRYPLIFLISSSIAFFIINTYFQADLVSKIGFTFGAGAIVTGVLWGILMLFNRNSGNNIPVSLSKEGLFAELSDIKLCPLCKHKVIKSKVFQDGDNYRQIIKCLNPECDYKKDLSFQI
jgi:hypothetical protein